MHCWDQRSIRGQPEVKLLEIPNGLQILVSRNPDQNVTHCLGGSKVMQVVIRGQPEGICLEMPKATKCDHRLISAYAATGAPGLEIRIPEPGAISLKIARKLLLVHFFVHKFI